MTRANEAPSVEKVQEDRWLQLFTTAVDVTVGTLWWIAESILKQHVPRYDQNSSRLGHPGLSLRRYTLQSPYECVPMLHGRSGGEGPVTARGLSEARGPDHVTSFGRIRPVAPVMVAQRWLRGSVSPNRHKPRLDAQEHARLLAWMKNCNL